MVLFPFLSNITASKHPNCTMEEVLNSTSKPCQPGVTGTANQVYDMDDVVEATIKMICVGNATVVSSTDASGHFLHIHAPKNYEDLQGKLTKTVGNASNVQGEFRMVEILIKNLKFFPIMGVNLPYESKVATKLTTDQLVWTPLEGQYEVFIGSLNKWILFTMTRPFLKETSSRTSAPI